MSPRPVRRVLAAVPTLALALGLVGLSPAPADAAYTTVVEDRGGRLQACRDTVGDGRVVRFRLDNRAARRTQRAGVVRERDGREVAFVEPAEAGRTSAVRTVRVLPGDRLVGAVLQDDGGFGVDFRRRDLLPC